MGSGEKKLEYKLTPTYDAAAAKPHFDAYVRAAEEAGKRANQAMQMGGGAKGVGDQTKAWERLGAAQKQAYEQLAQNAARSEFQLTRVAHAAHSTLKGVEQLTRGITLLGLSGEADLEKIVKKLMAVEGIMAAIKGGGNLAKGLSGMIGQGGFSFGSAVKRNPLTATGGELGIGGGAGSLVAGAGGAIGGPEILALVAALAATAGALKVLHEAATGTAKEMDSWTSKIGNWESGIVSAANKAGAGMGLSDTTMRNIIAAGGGPLGALLAGSGVSGSGQLKTDRMTGRLSASEAARLQQEERARRVGPLQTEQFRVSIQEQGREGNLFGIENAIKRQTSERAGLLSGNASHTEILESERRLNYAIQERISLLEKASQERQRSGEIELRNGQQILSNLQDQYRAQAQFIAQSQANDYGRIGKAAFELAAGSLVVPNAVGRSMTGNPTSHPMSRPEAQQNVKLLMEWARAAAASTAPMAAGETSYDGLLARAEERAAQQNAAADRERQEMNKRDRLQAKWEGISFPDPFTGITAGPVDYRRWEASIVAFADFAKAEGVADLFLSAKGTSLDENHALALIRAALTGGAQAVRDELVRLNAHEDKHGWKAPFNGNGLFWRAMQPERFATEENAPAPTPEGNSEGHIAGPDSVSPARRPNGGRTRGRKQENDPQKDEKLIADLAAAQSHGVRRKDFCKGRGISVRELEKAQARIRARRPKGGEE